jgi:hypothetical protein
VVGKGVGVAGTAVWQPATILSKIPATARKSFVIIALFRIPGKQIIIAGRK